MDGIHWWNERHEAWSHEGFDVSSFRNSLRAEPELASQLLIEFDAMVSRNRLLRRRVIDSSMPRDKKGRWLNELDDVSNTDKLLEKWNADASLNRPWEPYVHKAEERWSERGKRSNLSAIVRRLNALDPSSFSACQPLLILFDDVSSEQLISSMLDEIENDEKRRRNIVDEMIGLLNDEGIDASDARKMKISDALDHLASLQSRADTARTNRLRIEKEIRPFDDELAERLLTKKGDDITSEVDAIIENLSGRLKSITDMVDEWKIQGIIFPEGNDIAPQDLLDWEAGLPEIERVVDIHLRALERWRDFETLWPDKCGNSELAGHLNLTEEFVDLVDALDQEWKELELEGMQIINSWEDRGFAMDVWRSRVAEEPRSAVSWLKRDEEKYESASSLVDSLLALDTSIEGDEENIRRIAILREFELDNNILEEMVDFIDTRARRGARHRSMLEQEWMELIRRGLVEDLATSSLSLSEFEQLVSDARINRRSSGIPLDRLEERMKEEIETWYQNGFSVDAMEELLADDPMSLALRITAIRNAVAKHEQLRRRISALDWTRDPEMSVAVNMDLSRPDRLDSLAASIPQLMMDLSRRKVVDKDFNFIPWRPQKRSRPVLMPVPQNNVEDTMEAILEEMQSEEEVDLINFENETEPVIDDQKEQQDSEEVVDEISHPNNVTEVEEMDVTIISETDEELEKPEKREVPDLENSQNDSSIDSSVIVDLLRALGLEKDADMLSDNGDFSAVRRIIASHVGVEPRDMRLDRLLRLSLRLMMKGDEDDAARFTLIQTLTELAGILSKWTRTRLEARHNGSSGVLIEDAAALGIALERIPGPGTPVPLELDEYNLPPPDDLDGLTNEVKVLKRRIMLASSGGVR